MHQMSSEFLLCCDVGGTNTTIALLERNGNNFHMHATRSYASPALSGLAEALETSLSHFSSFPSPNRCCISSAGPIYQNNMCIPSNISWQIYANDIQKRFNFPVKIINDFTAIVYALPLLDPLNPRQLIPLPHVNGNTPAYRDNAFIAIGAGTGLGCGALLRVEDLFIPVQSEGGHADVSSFDHISDAISQFWRKRYHTPPGAELLVSGPGIQRIFQFFYENGYITNKTLASHIIHTAIDKQPELIATYAQKDPDCQLVMEYFLRFYGRAAANMVLYFAGQGSMFLAGGVTAKNIDLISSSFIFMESFENNYQSNLQKLLQEIPVYLVPDYSISLYGAAHAISISSLNIRDKKKISSFISD